MKKSEREAQKVKWIEDTQMFQRIAGVTETTTEELASVWESMHNKARDFNAENMTTHRIIQDAAIRAGERRNN